MRQPPVVPGGRNDDRRYDQPEPTIARGPPGQSLHGIQMQIRCPGPSHPARAESHVEITPRGVTFVVFAPEAFRFRSATPSRFVDIGSFQCGTALRAMQWQKMIAGDVTEAFPTPRAGRVVGQFVAFRSAKGRAFAERKPTILQTARRPPVVLA